MAKPGVRIISGKWKNSLLRVREVAGLRPTLVRVRKTMSDWLLPMQPLSVVDMFAGTGAVGFELASQGAKRVVLVERHPLAIADLRHNIERLEGAKDLIELVAGDSMHWQLNCDEVFDLIVIDPPFKQNFQSIATKVVASSICGKHSMIYGEQPRRTPCTLPTGWKIHRSTTSGEVVAQLWVRK